MIDGDAPITQDALNRMETTARRELTAHASLNDQRFVEHERQIRELNNSHDRAIAEKQRTDTEALRVQENSVTRKELQDWKDEVNKRLDLMAGAAAARAGIISGGVGIAVLLLNLVIRYFTAKP